MEITLIGARGLDSKNLRGDQSDPIVHFALAQHDSQESTIQRKTLNPVWNEKFIFEEEEDSSKCKSHELFCYFVLTLIRYDEYYYYFILGECNSILVFSYTALIVKVQDYNDFLPRVHIGSCKIPLAKFKNKMVS